MINFIACSQVAIEGTSYNDNKQMQEVCMHEKYEEQNFSSDLRASAESAAITAKLDAISIHVILLLLKSILVS